MFVRGVIASDRCRSASHIPVTGFRDAQKRLGGSCCMHFGCSRAPIWPLSSLQALLTSPTRRSSTSSGPALHSSCARIGCFSQEPRCESPDATSWKGHE